MPAPEANSAQKRERPSPSVLTVCVKKALPEIGAHSLEEATGVCLTADRQISDKWYLDSGASAHICGDRRQFSRYTRQFGDAHVVLGDNTHLAITGEGNVELQLNDGSSLCLHDVLHVPKIAKNLLSVSKLTTSDQVTVSFTPNACQIHKGQDLLTMGMRADDLYMIKVDHSSSAPHREQARAYAADIPKSHLDARLWHLRLGHPSPAKLHMMTKMELYQEPFLGTFMNLSTCITCIKAKQKVSPYPTSGGTRATQPLLLLHADLCGPVSVPSLGGGRYFLTIVDDYSHFTWVHILRHKSDVYHTFRNFHVLWEKQLGKQVCKLRTDNGGEFNSADFDAYCTEHGIVRELTTPYSSAQNGVAERKNRSLQETARALLKQPNLPLSYWGEAVNMAAYLQNRLPGASTYNKTPFELLYGRRPSLKHIRVFGVDAYAHQQSDTLPHLKLSDRAKKFVFIAFTEGIKAYKLYDPAKRQVIYSRSLTFDELPSTARGSEPAGGHIDISNIHTKFSVESSLDTSIEEQLEDADRDDGGLNGFEITAPEPDPLEEPDADEPMHVSEPMDTSTDDYNLDGASTPPTLARPTSETQTTTRTLRSRENIKPPTIFSPSKWQSSKARTDWQTGKSTTSPPDTPSETPVEAPPESVSDMAMWLATAAPEYSKHALNAAIQMSDEPTTLRQAFESSEADKWKKAADEEYASLIKNNTWTLTDLPQGRNVISNKWVFKRKYNEKGEIVRHKARLVVRGFSQKFGEDYTETFAPVAKFTTMRLLLAIAAQENLILQQMDVKTAYLNGVITEDIYMAQPEGYVDPKQRNKVCKLNKGIYGLKQSGRKWNEKLDMSLHKLGFQKSTSDPSLYIMRKGQSYLILLVYVDDILLASNSEHLMRVVKGLLNSEYEMTDIGKPKYILGVQIIRDKVLGTLSLNQGKYIDDMLMKFKMHESYPSATPLTLGIKLDKAPDIETLPKEE